MQATYHEISIYGYSRLHSVGGNHDVRFPARPVGIAHQAGREATRIAADGFRGHQMDAGAPVRNHSGINCGVVDLEILQALSEKEGQAVG